MPADGFRPHFSAEGNHICSAHLVIHCGLQGLAKADACGIRSFHRFYPDPGHSFYERFAIDHQPLRSLHSVRERVWDEDRTGHNLERMWKSRTVILAAKSPPQSPLPLRVVLGSAITRGAAQILMSQ
jgi:hypothetical protein